MHGLSSWFQQKKGTVPKWGLSPFRILFVLSFTLFLYLSFETFYINFWPSDSYNPYIPTAARLHNLQFPSLMHQIPTDGKLTLVMHGKEALILGIAIMQRILGDTQSLFPNTLLLLIAVWVSTLLFYFILKNLFGRMIGLIGGVLFMTSFMPYMYVLLGAHPPLALMNFLLAVLFLLLSTQLSGQNARGKNNLRFLFFSLASGFFLGLMFFSSPTAALYLPYYTGFLVYQYRGYRWGLFPSGDCPHRVRLLEILAGFIGTLLLFTLPNPYENLKQFINFMRFSQHGNNFVIYHDLLSHYFPLPDGLRGGGWIWIFKYFFFVSPILFAVYLAASIYLFIVSFKKQKWWVFVVVLISFSTPMGLEISRVAQFGRSYFSWMFGMIFIVCFAFYLYWEHKNQDTTKMDSKFPTALLTILLIGHVLFNGYFFFNEILPAKMATNKIYAWLMRHHCNAISVYRNHPLNKNIVWFLNNPKYKDKIYFWAIDSIKEVKSGFILIPPMTGKTILDECRWDAFEGDPELTKLFHSKDFSKYVVASFKTIAASRMWNQEEEICTYRDLIAGQITDADRDKGLVWLLDAEKLQKEWFNVE